MAYSRYIPFNIQAEIIKCLPVRSLIRFRSISKPWKSLIDSSEFILDHSVNQTRPRHLLVNYIDSQHDEKYVSIVDDDDDSFPPYKFPFTLPVSVGFVKSTRILGSSQGLFCFRSRFSLSNPIVIWNPSIRKSVCIDVHHVLDCWQHKIVIGFGVCPHTSDPKLVKITYACEWKILDVSVFALSLGVWRSLSDNVPRKSIKLVKNQVVIDSFIYWLAIDRIQGGDGLQFVNLILSFDMTTDEFTEVCLPCRLEEGYLDISSLRTSLIVLESKSIGNVEVYCVWRMEHGFPKSFKKLFIIEAPHASLKIQGVLGFRKTGEPIIAMYSYKSKQNAIYCYQPDSKRIVDIGISGYVFGRFASTYMETLLLFDHKDNDHVPYNTRE